MSDLMKSIPFGQLMEWILKDREVLVCDEKKVMADCRQAAKELADAING